MRGRSRVNDERAHITDIRQVGEQLECIDECLARLAPAAQVEGEHRACALRCVFLCALIVGRAGQTRIGNLLDDIALFSEELCNLLGVIKMTLDAQRERLNALLDKESIERRNRRARVTQESRADAGDESSGA